VARLTARAAFRDEIARLAKLIVDSEGVGFEEVEAGLRALTLEIVVGADATTAAAHAAVLTAVAVGHRSFVGGVRVVGALDQPLNTALPLKGVTLGEAAAKVRAVSFEGQASKRVSIGTADDPEGSTVAAWCDGWRAGTSSQADARWGDASNPLAGIAAGALAVGVAFEAARGGNGEVSREVNLWDADATEAAPAFSEIFLPGALWLVGLGNLGQAYLWALAALPCEDPKAVELVLQDPDRVSEENWSTSVLVHDETYGALKTRVGEGWAEAKGFTVRRVDRRLRATDRLEDGDPRIALSGVDKIAARRQMAKVGFECIVDAGLGRTAADFDKFRINIFDAGYPIERHFAGMKDAAVAAVPDEEAYRELEARIGPCGPVNRG
jgi:hypothetical protein